MFRSALFMSDSLVPIDNRGRPFSRAALGENPDPPAPSKYFQMEWDVEQEAARHFQDEEYDKISFIYFQ